MPRPEVDDRVGIAGDERVRYREAGGRDELELIGLGRVARLGAGAIDDERRRDLDPGRQLVVQRPDTGPLGRVGRQVLDLGQEPVVHDPQVDGADLVERQAAITIGQLAGDAAAGDLEAERDLERPTLVEPAGIDAQPVELGSHEREGRLRPDPAQEDHPSRSASASSPASPAIRRSGAESAPTNVQRTGDVAAEPDAEQGLLREPGQPTAALGDVAGDPSEDPSRRRPRRPCS